MLQHGVWKVAPHIHDPEIRTLACTLPRMLAAALAPTTNEKYSRGWADWVSWAEPKDEVTVLPADPFYVAIFLNHIMQSKGTTGAIRTAVYGINFAHHAAGYPSPTQDPFVKLVQKGGERLCAKPRKKKDPLTAPFIKELFDHYKPLFGKAPDLKVLRFLLITVLGFAGFFRIEEVLEAPLSAVRVLHDHLSPQEQNRSSAER